eukprot:Blabericola_migrator_1__779@NODE_1195_length_5142_cov_387_875271_g810_i0_p2_GENE_NODE_1195_length_5142_cov_387_875271_g810_i0NODE_1195_length_5142_cov_387_875271_g810_i0_p2_ORF_typecomplete_len412_score56_30IIGP/PF05049_13/1_3e07RsgA_GTPase/PF03193_16/0_047RsgA_GTPase/PF03193_16/1_2e03MMR_HSR1/PF01926_23/0_034AAA_22/PF13401_6/1_3AAA_22/PF13401_6/3_9e03AAA_22/PF13401_6/2_5e02T2SSE/PF00437_20/0_22AAA_28/PF13521_6/0_27AAA_33/PF13671_6/0_54FeoB_N/PF02421_18/0_53FeoB_N/PF02421_18/1_4e02FeoB_N/PF02421
MLTHSPHMSTQLVKLPFQIIFKKMNIVFTGSPGVGTSTLLQTLTGNNSPPPHILHHSYNHIICHDVPILSQDTADADILVLVFTMVLSQVAVLLVSEQYNRGKPVILVHSRMSYHTDSSESVEACSDNIREQIALNLREHGLPMLSVYCVDGLDFWNFNFEEAGFLFDLYHLCGCSTINIRKEQILRRSSSRIPCRGAMAVLSFSCESRETRNRFLKWWFPSPIPLEFLLFELSAEQTDLTVGQLQKALLRKQLDDVDIIVIMASEELLYENGRRVAQHLIEACRLCENVLPPCVLISTITSHLSQKITNAYPTSFVRCLPIQQSIKPSQIQHQILSRMFNLNTTKDSVLRALNRVASISHETKTLTSITIAVINHIAYWYTHYTSIYILTLAYAAVMMGLSSILASLLLW